MKLKSKTALITGGARGIGLGFAQAYAREGAKVVIADIDIERATRAATAIGPAASAVKLDITDLDAIERVAAEVDQASGGIDILVNNAAIFDMAPITDITEASYDRVFDINLKGPLFMMKAVANLMIKRGAAARSSIWPARPAAAARRWCCYTAPQGSDHLGDAVCGAGARQARHQRQRHRARRRRRRALGCRRRPLCPLGRPEAGREEGGGGKVRPDRPFRDP